MEDGQIGNAGDKLAIVWSEHGGPEVKPPRHPGFGSRWLKERWKDTARLDFNATRLTCFILVDLNHRLDPMRASS
jgi:hypothetical protein